jgi:hypothetical protein
MVRKFILNMVAISCVGLSLSSFAEQMGPKLTQDEFNQLIQRYTRQVNATKQILDEEQSKYSATEQRKAFCSRLDAYQEIALISRENMQLDTANMMLSIANNFLLRQEQTMQQSGMKAEMFCLVEK